MVYLFENKDTPYTGTFREHYYFWPLLLIGCILTISAGYINGIAVFQLYHHAITHISGTTTVLGVRAVTQKWGLVGMCIGDIGFFVIGAFIAAYMVSFDKFHLHRWYGIGFIINSLAILGAMFSAMYYTTTFDFGSFVMALACGIQNGLTSTYSGNILRTTHVTGMLNDTGMLLAYWARTGETKDLWRLKVFLPLYFSFMLGGFLGTWAYEGIGNFSLIVPATLSMIISVTILVSSYIPDYTVALVGDHVDEKIVNPIRSSIEKLSNYGSLKLGKENSILSKSSIFV